MAKANATLKAADFLILEALNRKPMTTTELAKALQISRDSVRLRIKRFQKLGLVLQQYPDRRWVIKLIVRVETVNETLEQVGLTSGSDQPKIMSKKALPNAPEAAQIASEDVLPPPPDLGAAEELKPDRKAVPPKVPVSPNALKLSERFNLPAHKYRMGELNMGAMGGCMKCGKGTPFRYGEQNLCPLCARKS